MQTAEGRVDKITRGKWDGWPIPITLKFRRPKKEDHELEAFLSHLPRSVFQNTREKKKKVRRLI